MQTILPPSGNTIKILGKARSAEHGLRWMTYVLAQPVEGGVLVFHTLTRALLLLTPEEYAAPDNLPELRDGWFRVPQEMDDMKYADQVRFIRRTMWKEPEHTTTYTIFTTTDCNLPPQHDTKRTHYPDLLPRISTGILPFSVHPQTVRGYATRSFQSIPP